MQPQDAGRPSAASRLRTSPFRLLSRSGRGVRTAVQSADLARELGPRATRRYLADRASARSWAPAARRAVYARIWAEAARIVGAECRELGDDFTLVSKGAARTVVKFHNVQLNDPVTLELALVKPLVHRLLGESGVAVSVNREFTSTDTAPGLAMLDEFQPPFVVKPAAGTSGGSGVTCAIDSPADFRRAVLHASRVGERLLIERAVSGLEYRFLLLDGELLDVVRRDPVRLVGDGESSIARLISLENERRAAWKGLRGMSFLDIDLDCVLTLDQAGLDLRSVPPAGASVQVKSAANENGAGDNVTVDRDSIASELVAEARRAASALQLRLAGIDLITPDISQPLARSGGAVIEVNGTPGLHYHYLVADPASATRAAVPVLQTLLQARGA